MRSQYRHVKTSESGGSYRRLCAVAEETRNLGRCVIRLVKLVTDEPPAMASVPKTVHPQPKCCATTNTVHLTPWESGKPVTKTNQSREIDAVFF